MSTPAVQPDAPAPRRSPWRHVIRICIGVVVVLLISLGTISWYATTSQFQNRVRQRLISTLQDATGGRVELQAFRWRLLHLEFEADNLTIHGLEGPGEAPYLHVDQLFVRAKVITFFRPRIGLNLLDVRHPLFHLIFYPDGSTNQPVPKKKSTSDKPVTETLFDLAVDHTEVSDGVALLNQRSIPFNLAANDLAATVTYAAQTDRYLASLQVSDLTAQRGKLAPVDSHLELKVDMGRNQANLQSLSFTTGPSRLDATASVQDFANPQWKLAANGRIDVREVEALTAIEGLDRGVADLALQGQGTLAKFNIDGQANITGADYKASYAHTGMADVTTAIHINETDLGVTGIRARLREGGSLDAEVHLLNWLSPRTPTAPATPAKVAGRTGSGAGGSTARAVTASATTSSAQHGIIRARIHGITLRTVMSIVTEPRFQNLGFDTAATGDAAVDWVGGPVQPHCPGQGDTRTHRPGSFLGCADEWQPRCQVLQRQRHCPDCASRGSHAGYRSSRPGSAGGLSGEPDFVAAGGPDYA